MANISSDTYYSDTYLNIRQIFCFRIKSSRLICLSRVILNSRVCIVIVNNHEKDQTIINTYSSLKIKINKTSIVF